MLRYSTLCGALLAISCGASAPLAPRDPAAHIAVLPAEDEAILLAVVEHIMKASPHGASAPICLVIRVTQSQMGDPSVALLDTARDEWPSMVQDSACEGGGPDDNVRLRASRKEAYRIDIGPVTKDGANAARVVGGDLYAGGSGTSEIEYKLTREGGTWRVVSQRTLLMI